MGFVNIKREVYHGERYLVNKKVFKDEFEHPYVMHFYDGLAVGHHNANGDFHCSPKVPNTILMSYPTINELSHSPKKLIAIYEYIGKTLGEELTYFDVALLYGKMGKYGLTTDELNLIEKIAHHNKVDTWLDVTREGNFRDREEGKEITAQKAMHDFIGALQWEDFAVLTDEEKFTLVCLIGKLLK